MRLSYQLKYVSTAFTFDVTTGVRSAKVLFQSDEGNSLTLVTEADKAEMFPRIGGVSVVMSGPDFTSLPFGEKESPEEVPPEVKEAQARLQAEKGTNQNSGDLKVADLNPPVPTVGADPVLTPAVPDPLVPSPEDSVI